MNLGRAIGPVLLTRLEPGTAGTVGFLIRLATLAITVLVALRLAGLKPETLAVGGAITATASWCRTTSSCRPPWCPCASPAAWTSAPGWTGRSGPATRPGA